MAISQGAGRKGIAAEAAPAVALIRLLPVAGLHPPPPANQLVPPAAAVAPAMTETEGVIKFRFTRRPGDATSTAELAELEGWRAVLHRLNLVGQDPARYGGVGFGNLSRRSRPAGELEFLVTGSGTGARPRLEPADYARVTGWDLETNTVETVGTADPSSESMTHAAIYQAAREVRWVFHGHCPEIWEQASRLGLPATPPDVEYGTPAMAAAVGALVDRHGADGLVLAMAGHRDGVIAMGGTAEAAGSALIGVLARALAPRT